MSAFQYWMSVAGGCLFTVIGVLTGAPLWAAIPIGGIGFLVSDRLMTRPPAPPPSGDTHGLP